MLPATVQTLLPEHHRVSAPPAGRAWRRGRPRRAWAAARRWSCCATLPRPSQASSAWRPGNAACTRGPPPAQRAPPPAPPAPPAPCADPVCHQPERPARLWVARMLQLLCIFCGMHSGLALAPDLMAARVAFSSRAWTSCVAKDDTLELFQWGYQHGGMGTELTSTSAGWPHTDTLHNRSPAVAPAQHDAGDAW